MSRTSRGENPASAAFAGYLGQDPLSHVVVLVLLGIGTVGTWKVRGCMNGRAWTISVSLLSSLAILHCSRDVAVIQLSLDYISYQITFC
ncbi:hypothetical protein BD310DRAFT_935687 [Dichomitus squalens]|uniref:Uncharacterized protein n=1 Tax=Dichomitus squalens TaxID=114155 RepID=A0A4V2K739_9APHY|nr:hypothetical protein BD310DRAFT_935687 [Dichomitus squalens]